MSLRDKYTNEEWDALEKKASNTIAERCAKLFSFGSAEKKESLDMYDLLVKPKAFEYARYADYNAKKILSQITHKVYEKKFDGKCPEVIILSENDYRYFTQDLEFKTDYIDCMGCRLKIHVSTNAEDGNVEIY